MTLLLHILSLEQLDIEKLEKATDDLQVEVIVNRGALLTEIYKVAKAVRRLTPGLELGSPCHTLLEKPRLMLRCLYRSEHADMGKIRAQELFSKYKKGGGAGGGG